MEIRYIRQYHDDGTDVADIDNLLLYYQESAKIYREYDMEFTPTKSELIINKNVRIDQLPQEFQQFIIWVEEVEILGIPIGNIDYMPKIKQKMKILVEYV